MKFDATEFLDGLFRRTETPDQIEHTPNAGQDRGGEPARPPDGTSGPDAAAPDPRLWYIELAEHLAAVTAGPGESAARTDERIGELLAEYADRQLRDGWTLTRCATDLRARIRAATKQVG